MNFAGLLISCERTAPAPAEGGPRHRLGHRRPGQGTCTAQGARSPHPGARAMPPRQPQLSTPGPGSRRRCPVSSYVALPLPAG